MGVDTKHQKSGDAVHAQSKRVYFLSVTVHNTHITLMATYSL